MRNTFTLLTIILSVALISGLALFVFGVRQADKNQLDTMQHVLYQNLSNRQAEHLQSDERIADSVILKSGTRVGVDDYTIQPLYIQQAESTIASQKVIEGKLPRKAERNRCRSGVYEANRQGGETRNCLGTAEL